MESGIEQWIVSGLTNPDKEGKSMGRSLVAFVILQLTKQRREAHAGHSFSRISKSEIC